MISKQNIQMKDQSKYLSIKDDILVVINQFLKQFLNIGYNQDIRLLQSSDGSEKYHIFIKISTTIQNMKIFTKFINQEYNKRH